MDPFGQIVGQLASGDGTLVADVSTETRQTIYKRFGDWFLWFAGALVVAGIITERRRNRPAVSKVTA